MPRGPRSRAIEDGAAAGLDHIRRHFARQIQQTHHVDLKIPIEHFRLDLEKCPPPAAHGVVDEDIRRAVPIADVRDDFSNLAFAGDIADHCVGVGEFLFQRANAIRRARQGNDTKSFDEKRRTIAEPVPGPTPVTMAIGLSGIGTSPGLASSRQDP
jgi:hypothetical protein